MGAEGREGVTWRSGCAFQAALSKVLGLRRVAFSRAEKAACVAGIETGVREMEALLEGHGEGCQLPC